MGNGFFHKGPPLAGPPPMVARPSLPNMMARSIAAPSYAARADAGAAAKDVGAVQGLIKATGAPVKKNAAAMAAAPKT